MPQNKNRSRKAQRGSAGKRTPMHRQGTTGSRRREEEQNQRRYSEAEGQ